MRVTAIITVLPFLFTTPGAAQDTRMPQEQPGGPNSGAGIPGKPGGKSGPAVKPPNETTGSAVSPDEGRNRDVAKVPGLPGSKSGPAVKPPPGPVSR
jgi:hypothetical protein